MPHSEVWQSVNSAAFQRIRWSYDRTVEGNDCMGLRTVEADVALQAAPVIGYEPATSGDDVVLRNCPFRHVAQARPEIICQMNLAFVAGLVAGTQTRSRHAVLSPSTEWCCVVVTS